MKRQLVIGLLCCALLAACERKPEQHYNALLGDWFVYAAYREGGNTDLLPLADLLGYACLKTSVLHVPDDTTFELESDCDVLACNGTYTQHGEVIQGITSDGDTLIFNFFDGVLSTIQDIDIIGRMDLRFQKK